MVLKRATTFLLCILLVFIVPFNVWAEEVSDISIIQSQGFHSIDAAYSVMGEGQLVKNAQSVFLYETNTDTLLYSWQADRQIFPASFVKIMTALLVLENAELSETVTVSQNALNGIPRDAVSVKLKVGEELTVEQLLYCLIISSANDAAAVLAEHVADSQSAFVELMNKRAAELGCTGTVYKNPHGLHHDEQYTTAKDTCRILLAALEHETFRVMFGTPRYNLPATNLSAERYIASNNFFINTEEVGIHYDNRITGGRSGITTDGLRCVASTSQSGNMEVICIVMGAQSTLADDGINIKSYGGFQETSDILDTVYARYSGTQVIYKDQIIDQQPVLGGDSHVFLATRDSYTTILPKGLSQDDLIFRYQVMSNADRPPIEKGQDYAYLEVWYENCCVAQTVVYAVNSVESASVKVISSDSNRNGLPWWGILLIILGVVLAAVTVYLFILRFNAQKKHRKFSAHKKHITYGSRR